MATTKKAGHRRWAPKGGKAPGGHRGDIMSPTTRSRVMSRIRGKNTSPERAIAPRLLDWNTRFEQHVSELPGRPDFVFRETMLAVFVDGDFWHGWRFPLWEHKLSEMWRAKIAATRTRDRRNFAKLRRRGWKVLRIWEHQVERDPERCVEIIRVAAEHRSPNPKRRRSKL